jgi:hypothetical protein
MFGADTNKKKVAALIVSRMKPDGQSEHVGVEGEKPAISEGERSAGEEAISAIKSGDVEAFVSALKSLISIVSDSDESEEEESSEEPKPSFMG